MKIYLRVGKYYANKNIKGRKKQMNRLDKFALDDS